jgi:hypothetical protein
MNPFKRLLALLAFTVRNPLVGLIISGARCEVRDARCEMRTTHLAQRFRKWPLARQNPYNASCHSFIFHLDSYLYVRRKFLTIFSFCALLFLYFAITYHREFQS